MAMKCRLGNFLQPERNLCLSQSAKSFLDYMTRSGMIAISTSTLHGPRLLSLRSACLSRVKLPKYH